MDTLPVINGYTVVAYHTELRSVRILGAKANKYVSGGIEYVVAEPESLTSKGWPSGHYYFRLDDAVRYFNRD